MTVTWNVTIERGMGTSQPSWPSGSCGTTSKPHCPRRIRSAPQEVARTRAARLTGGDCVAG